MSHFDNTVRNTLKNAFLISLINIPYTIFFIIALLLPIVAVYMEPRMMMAFVLIGFSGPALLTAVGWSKIFKKLEPPKEEDEIEEDEEDDEDDEDEEVSE